MPVLGYGVSSGSGSSTAAGTSYDNSTSGLTATDVKAAIDEIVAAGGATAVVSRMDITGLTGGTASDLDSITTTAITTPYAVAILNSDAFEVWVLQDGTDAENAAAGIVRPDDYATTTNEKVWYAKIWEAP